ncbi:MAG TPA: hypothetical protein VNJ01_02795 [Bacteriovoracaceae bacterium]|nr:hypothetical protein [Bacteriovoracaceae bacterium]
MKLSLSLIIFFLTTSVVAAPLGLFEKWSNISDPRIMGPTFVHLFNYLPLKANVTDEKKYWSGDYWPLKNGNINFRWKAPTPTGFDLVSPSKEELLTMTPEQIMILSPSEKFDLLRGDYEYSLKKEVSKIANPQALGWEGICHGWAPASINHNEPLPKVMKNPDGIEIPFGSADIKGLVSYFYAHAYKVRSTRQMGLRCYREETEGVAQCTDDLNAGAFHIVLTNMIGIHNTGFVADLVRTTQVWNHPIYGYESTVVGHLPPGPRAAPGTDTVIRLKTEVKYGSEFTNNWEATNGTSQQVFYTKIFEYDLELSTYGDILGGEWVSENRPDFLWMKDKPAAFTGRFALLGQLLND